jgi:heptosyltransferase-2
LKPLSEEKLDRILIRSTNWIGDAVMTTPAMGMIREAFPGAEIVVVANPVVAPLFSSHPYCDRVLIFDKRGAHRGLRGLLKFSAELRRERFDAAILLQNAFEAALLAKLGGIPRRAGYRSDGRGWLLNYGVPVGEKERRLHHTAYYRLMLRSLGFPGGDDGLRLALADGERADAQEMLGQGGTWFAVNPGAAYGSAKRWFPERFAAVGDRLEEEFDARIVLTGGPGEAEIGRDIEAAMGSQPLNLIGKTSVRQMMAILSLCRLMVTNDSGPMHVAAALGVPLVAIFGPTDHTTTSPAGEKCRVVRHDVGCAPCLLRQCPTDHRCMKAVTVEDVLSAARDLLRRAE